jgi:hypothetical protein
MTHQDHTEAVGAVDGRRRVEVQSWLRRLVMACIGLAFASGATAAAQGAPRFICYPVVPGDTVTGIAIRLTPDARNWRDPGFQVFDPLRARFVPKIEYGRIQPGWQVCLIEPLLRRSAAVQPADGVLSSAAGATVAASRTAAPLRWWWLVLLCSATGAALVLVQARLQRGDATCRMLEGFGNAFIREFERPLVEERGTHTAGLRTQVNVCRRRRSLDVRLAPSEGRTYPNLADHRMNVEYDVQRVMAVLNDRRFIRGPLDTRGEWVTIPFRLASDLQKEGEP